MMLTCKEFDEFMIDYLEGGLPVWQKYMCWLHIKMCRECANFVSQYRRTVALGKTAFDNPEGQVPDSVPEELIKAALARRKPN
jgi:hypothetical protein